MFNHILIRMMCSFLLLLAGTVLFQMGFVANTLHKYNISGTIYSTAENEVDKVMPNKHIDLMEKDGLGNTNDNLGQAVTDGQGHFEGLVGKEDEEEEQEPYLLIHIDNCGFKWPPQSTTSVWLPSTPERQNVSIYLGYKPMAMLHRDGQEDLPLEIYYC